MAVTSSKTRWRVSYRSSVWAYVLTVAITVTTAIILLHLLMRTVERLAWWYVGRFESVAPF